jgi:uncharacterized membrane protein YphA (DoxX/SURF4 family)
MMADYAAAKGVPAAKVAVPGSGLLLLIGGLSLLLGFQPLIGIVAILVFLLPTTFMIHNFWTISEPMQKMGEMVNFTKNWALFGYTLMLLAIPRPWPFSVGG